MAAIVSRNMPRRRYSLLMSGSPKNRHLELTVSALKVFCSFCCAKFHSFWLAIYILKNERGSFFNAIFLKSSLSKVRF